MGRCCSLINTSRQEQEEKESGQCVPERQGVFDKGKERTHMRGTAGGDGKYAVKTEIIIKIVTFAWETRKWEDKEACIQVRLWFPLAADRGWRLIVYHACSLHCTLHDCKWKSVLARKRCCGQNLRGRQKTRTKTNSTDKKIFYASFESAGSKWPSQSKPLQPALKPQNKTIH